MAQGLGQRGAPLATRRVSSDDDEVDGDRRPTRRKAKDKASSPRKGGKGGVKGKDASTGAKVKVRVKPPKPDKSDNTHTFAALLERLRTGHASNHVIRQDSWDILANKVKTPDDVNAVLELLKADAVVRENNSCDWNRHGYGNTLLKIVEVSALAGVYDVVQQMVAMAPMLHLNLSDKNLLGSMIRRMVKGGAVTQHLRPVYDMERQALGGQQLPQSVRVGHLGQTGTQT
ncbi:hypothetical protein V8C86DRAFT_2536970 [Haematococcus lacustris]